MHKSVLGRLPSTMDTTMSRGSDLETMAAVCGRQAGSAGRKGAPAEFWVACDPRRGCRQVSHRPLLALDTRTQLWGQIPPQPAALPVPRPRAASPAPNPARIQGKMPLRHPAGPVCNQRRARCLRTFCRLCTRFSNARAAATGAAAAALSFRLATRPAGPVPGRGRRTKGDRDQGR